MSDVEQAKAHFFAALDLMDAKDFAGAETRLRAALAIVPDRVSALSNLAVALFEQDKTGEAIATAERALAMAPDNVELLLALGSARGQRGETEAALAAMDRAVQAAPEMPQALIGRGAAHIQAKQYDRAIADFRAARRLGASDELLGRLLSAQSYACEWSDYDSLAAALLAGVRDGTEYCEPFVLLGLPGATSADLLACGRAATARSYPAMPALWRGETRRGDRIRVAYVSGDFRAHPLSQLMPGIFEQHDRSRFEVFGFSTGPDDGSPQRARVAAAFEHFVDVFDRGDDEIAAAIHERGIDIAVDLGGLTSGGRMRAFARRPAPVQVSYLGFPGTSGAPYLDYILADAVVIPPDQVAFYSEKPVWLPDTYYPNDDRRPIGPKSMTRSEAGLPRDGFVFCCFNNAYKLNPATFGAWMRMLLAVPGSVLWLYRSNPAMETNLRREAAARGVDPARLVFAANLPPERHLARHGLADLCLDTGPYNAHTTACDALWTGVPIVTWLGETFPSRVAGSVLHAVGLDELVAPSFPAYEELAIGLARDPVRLSRIRTKLADNRNTTPLFDTRRLTRHIESAYVTMAGRHRRGAPPAAFSVAPIA